MALYSMTGYGKHSVEFEGKKITVEVRSLNSKNFDFISRIPSVYKVHEIEVRNTLKEKLERGKVEVFLWIEIVEGVSNTKINKSVFSNYYSQIESLSNEFHINLDKEQLLSNILRLPDILSTTIEEIKEEEKESIFFTLDKAIEQVQKFRKQEGEALEKDIVKRIDNIKEALETVKNHDEDRIKAVREKLLKRFNDIKNSVELDKNRFEQELIYYLEKLDITEEKVRLLNHLSYFLKNIKSDKPIGKKLIFISQEIGREINTIGSKANQADIQMITVKMKDELEKIKEQLMNVL